MQIVRTVAELRTVLRDRRSGGVGLVPTMGALHDGHLALARRAAAENGITVMTIFVNPTQFNDPADLAAYPRDEAADAELAAYAGVDVVFAPAPDEVYPPGFTATVALHGPLVETLEGAHRGPGHFRGVTTVVTKLLNMASPDRAYLGQKDAQQARVIRALVRDLDIPTEIVIVPTVREHDGLAMSSRNRRLTPRERSQAAGLYAALSAAQDLSGRGERTAAPLLDAARAVLVDHAIEAEYLALVDAETFAPVQTVTAGPAVLAVAAHLGDIRLIDNVIIETA